MFPHSGQVMGKSTMVISGPMFSGKSTELLRQLERFALSGKSISYYVPDVDTRTRQEIAIKSTRKKYQVPVNKLPADLKDYNIDCTDVVVIDEVHFFEPNIVTVVEQLRNWGLTVLVAGLDMDYRRN